MFTGSRKSKRKTKKKNKKPEPKIEYDKQQFQVDIKDTKASSSKMYETDENGQPYGETERALLRLHQNLIDFYSKHDADKVNEEVLTILMQFFIDAGGVALNRKLMQKYGEDLQTFKRVEEPPPLPADVNDVQRTSATIMRMKRASVNKELDDMGIDAAPPPVMEVNTEKLRDSRNSGNGKAVAPSFGYKPKKKKKHKNKELQKFHEEQKDEKKANLEEVEDIFKDMDEPAEDPSLLLFLLDTPAKVELSVRDKIEAFYSVHDESKLDNERSMDKFVAWVKENSLQALSEKLRKKYSSGLEDYDQLARRRRNLEDLLTKFYLKHDRPKLDTRWTILKILHWTMTNGVAALNKKFVTRYGHPVVKVPQNVVKFDNDLDI